MRSNSAVAQHLTPPIHDAHWLQQWRLLFPAVIILFFVLSSPLKAATEPAANPDSGESVYRPFQAGDRFAYNLYWSRIKVGEAVLSFRNGRIDDDSGSPEYLEMRFSVRTSGIANRLYRVDNLLVTFIDVDNWRPVLHRKRQREGSRERAIELAFDWEKGEVQYSNRGNKRDPVAITDDTQDPLSLLGKIAQLPFFIGATFSIPASDGREPADMEAEIVGEETTRTPLGTFRSFKADVSTDELRGVFSKSPDAVIEVWFTADKYRVPIRMRSEVAVGSFYGELSNYRSNWLDGHEAIPSFEHKPRPVRRLSR